MRRAPAFGGGFLLRIVTEFDTALSFVHTEGVESKTTMTPSADLQQLRVNGVTYDVLQAKPYTWNGLDRMYYQVKRPRGRRTYIVFGYENGTFSQAT